MRLKPLFLLLPLLLAACTPAMRCNGILSDGDSAGAETCFRQALAAEPDSAKLRFGLGMALFRQKQYDRAIHAFQDVLAVSPRNPEATFRLGLSYLGAGQADKAWKTLWAYNPPFKYYLRQSVLEVVERLQAAKDVDREATIRLLEDAKAKGQELQDRADAEEQTFRDCPMCDEAGRPGWQR